MKHPPTHNPMRAGTNEMSTSQPSKSITITLKREKGATMVAPAMATRAPPISCEYHPYWTLCCTVLYCIILLYHRNTTHCLSEISRPLPRVISPVTPRRSVAQSCICLRVVLRLALARPNVTPPPGQNPATMGRTSELNRPLDP